MVLFSLIWSDTYVSIITRGCERLCNKSNKDEVSITRPARVDLANTTLCGGLQWLRVAGHHLAHDLVDLGQASCDLGHFCGVSITFS